MPRATVNEEEKPGVVASLPEPSAIEDDTMASRARELLHEALAVKLRHDKDRERLDEITQELTVIARGYSLPGIRQGRIGLLYNGERSNKFLDKALLIEHGVSPEVISASYRATKPFTDARLMLLKR